MKLIIDIDENMYGLIMSEKYDCNNCADYSARCIQKGIPLDDIKAEIEKQKIIIHSKAFESEYKSPMLNGQLSGISIALDIIDKHKGGKA